MYRVITLLLYLIYFSFAKAQTGKVPLSYLQLSGSVKEIRIQNGYTRISNLEGATIQVLNSANKEIFSEQYDAKKRVSVKLPLNENFVVRITKEGYVSKFFLVNTIVAKQKTNIYRFPFDVSLFKKIPDLDIELTNPVAIVQFFSRESRFDYDYEYTEEMNAELKAKYSEHYLLESTSK